LFDEDSKEAFSEILEGIRVAKLTISQVFQLMNRFSDLMNEENRTFSEFFLEESKSFQAGWQLHQVILGGSILLVAAILWTTKNQKYRL